MKVLVFLFDRYITHQELYASAGSREGQNGGGAVGRERFMRHPKGVCLNSPCTF